MPIDGGKIRERMRNPDHSYPESLLVTPLLSKNQIGASSIDIRLGFTILIHRRTYLASHDVTEEEVRSRFDTDLYKRIDLKFGQHFILHPGEVILGSTFEYLSLPPDLSCDVVGRSSWGRLGLVIATASIAHPGFKGCLTLELNNVSETPIKLYPGIRIGQLIFQEVTTEGDDPPTYQGTYDCPTGPEPPTFSEEEIEEEFSVWPETDPF